VIVHDSESQVTTGRTKVCYICNYHEYETNISPKRR
jgi:hypothetical protein